MSKKVLGRGLSDLFADKISLIQNDNYRPDVDNFSSSNDKSAILELELNDVHPCATQPRRIFDEDALRELADSIRANGVLQPIIVREKNGSYEIIAGERRWRASRIAGKTSIPAIVKNIDDESAFLISVIENLQRMDLSPIEEAEVYQRLIDGGYTHEQIGSMLNKSRSHVSNFLRLINLSDNVKKMINDRLLSVGHAKLILAIGSDFDSQDKVAEEMVKKNLNIKQADDLIKKFINKRDGVHSENEKGAKVVYEMDEVAKLLKENLEADVMITNKQIVINYKSMIDLDRILSIIVG
jgi:ParB family chromosome partitioning protein